MSRRSARMDFCGHQITLYHHDGVEHVVEPGYCVVAEDYILHTVKEEDATPSQTIVQRGATMEEWQTAISEYERRTG